MSEERYETLAERMNVNNALLMLASSGYAFQRNLRGASMPINHDEKTVEVRDEVQAIIDRFECDVHIQADYIDGEAELIILPWNSPKRYGIAVPPEAKGCYTVCTKRTYPTAAQAATAMEKDPTKSKRWSAAIVPLNGDWPLSVSIPVTRPST